MYFLKDIKAIIFDLDDTLLDRSRTFHKYCEYLIENFFPKNIQDKEEIIKRLSVLDNNGYKKRKIFCKEIIDEYKLNYNIEEIENNWYEKFNKFCVAEENLIDILEYLTIKYKLAIITNGSNYMQNLKINTLGIVKYFDDIIISENVGIEKPNRDIFLLSCKNLRIQPFEAVYIGDNFEKDIVGATNAGLKAIWYNKIDINTKYTGNCISELKMIYKIL